MAVADAKYRFSFVDVGAFGSEGDSTIFAKSSLAKGIDNGTITLPPPASFPGSHITRTVPNVFVADDAFPLKPYIMKPFGGGQLTTEQLIFNYRLSRARRVVENSFGILAAKFRIFHTPIHARPEVVDKIIWAACCLHNFLIDHQGLEAGLTDSEVNGLVTPGEWRNDTQSGTLRSLRRAGSNNYSQDSKEIRNEFMRFCVSELGSLSWQLQHVNKGKT